MSDEPRVDFAEYDRGFADGQAALRAQVGDLADRFHEQMAGPFETQLRELLQLPTCGCKVAVLHALGQGQFYTSNVRCLGHYERFGVFEGGPHDA